MKEYFYTLNDKNGIPSITVCLIHDNENMRVHRGIAIRSKKDEPNEEYGKQVAKRVALRCMKGRSFNNEIKNKAAIRMLIETKAPFTVRAGTNPSLSMFEQRLIFGKKFKDFGYTPYLLKVYEHVQQFLPLSK